MQIVTKSPHSWQQLESAGVISNSCSPEIVSGIILRALGFPTNMFTVLFAIGRTVGWIAHWKEMMEAPESRIGRPRQLYVGSKKREFTSVANREHTDRKISWSWLWGGKKASD